MAQVVKNWLAIQETRVQFLGWEDPWRRAWQPTPGFLPGESPWTEEPGGLQSMGSRSVRHDLATKQQPADERGDSVLCSPLSAVQTSHFLSSSEEWRRHRYPTSAPLPAPPKVFRGLTGLICQPLQTDVHWTPRVSKGKDGEAELIPGAGKEALFPLCKGPEMNTVSSCK